MTEIRKDPPRFPRENIPKEDGECGTQKREQRSRGKFRAS